MCSTCGCSDEAGWRISAVDGAVHEHHHGHPHEHPHEHPRRPTETVTIEQNLLAKNDLLAQANRDRLAARGTVALNLMSSPGAGKTTLLVRTIAELVDRIPVSVIEGDQETLLDADRIRETGSPVVQINTGAGCHLDAGMVGEALTELDPSPGSVLFIENVGNLVCPALFDLGEAGRVVVISVTEGDDKPLKYPHMFAAADLVLINKSDLLPYVDFDVETCTRQARLVNPHVEVLVLSARSGEGLDDWYGWLLGRTGRDKPPSLRGIDTHAARA